jgi:hypothetical protein
MNQLLSEGLRPSDCPIHHFREGLSIRAPRVDEAQRVPSDTQGRARSTPLAR